jgi:hypothetical protein
LQGAISIFRFNDRASTACAAGARQQRRQLFGWTEIRVDKDVARAQLMAAEAVRAPGGKPDGVALHPLQRRLIRLDACGHLMKSLGATIPDNATPHVHVPHFH